MSVIATDVSDTDRCEYVLRLADDSLILSHRLSEWTSWAPQIEEDLALVNIGLDLLGQARNLLTYAGEMEGEGRSEDDLAFLRQERDFRNVVLVEQPTLHEFAKVIAVLFYYSAYSVPLYEQLSSSPDTTLAEIAAKSLKEVRYHLEHAAGWVVRLGDGTDLSHARMQEAIDEYWPIAGDLFEVDALVERLVSQGVVPHPDGLRNAWEATVGQVLDEASLTKPERDFRPGGGRTGLHSEHLGYILAEMQYIHRLHPGVHW